MSPTFTTLAEATQGARVDARASLIRLVIPYRLAVEPPPDDEQGEADVRPWCAETEWTRKPDSESFLEHARTIVLAWRTDDVRKVAGLPVSGQGARDAVLLRGRHDTRAVSLQGAEVVLFETAGIVFVVVEVAPHGIQPGRHGASREANLVDWVDLLAEARFVAGDRAPTAELVRSTGRSTCEVLWPAERAGQVLDVGDHLVTAAAAPHGESSDANLATIFDEVITHALPSRLVAEPLFLKGQALTFLTLLIDDLAQDDKRDLVRYVVRNQLRSGAQIGYGEEARTREPHNRMPYAAGQDFLLSIESSSYLAFDVPDGEFFRRTMPSHVGREYLFAWLFALHQRVFLLGQIESLATLASRLLTVRERRIQVIAEIDRLAAFEARGYELHLLQREHHHRFWNAARRTFDVEALHDYVSSLLDRAHRRLDAEQVQIEDVRRRRTERLVVVALTVPSIVLGLLGINISGITSKDGISDGVALWLAVSMVALLGFLLWRTRVKSPNPDE